ncbi:MAG: Grx4 family monothiol glutaredoxin [Candidatus Paracaedibacteraceae bacterium]|jgi:monothiol glutaredoxin|nr:Grx4 family monothiol glutaredoxin [Candidatus Paracaedibacteraceae bacterium]
MARNIHAELETTIKASPIVLFMKGDAEMPQCGFSAVVVQILKLLDKPFTAVNVLLDAEIRQGIKDFSNWPTIPQLYISGEFIGGCDIVREMYQTGELRQILESKGL